MCYPSTGDSGEGDAPRITPKDIPAVVASVEGVAHITIDGILGGDYTLILQRDDARKRKRTQEGEKACGTVTDANEKLSRYLERVDVYGMTDHKYQELIGRYQEGSASLEDTAMLKKIKVQRFYRDKINASDVEEFNKFKVPLFVRAFHKAFPHVIARERIASKLELLGNSRQIYGISDKIREAAELVGFKTMGVGGERLALKSMSAAAKKELENTIAAIRNVKLVRRSRAADLLEELKCYLKSVWGYKLKSHKVRRATEKWRVYSLVDMVPEKLLCNEMYSENWLASHCKAVDALIGSGHDERKQIMSLLLSATVKVAKNDMLPFKLNTGIDYTKPIA